jgi:hypothetical protein
MQLTQLSAVIIVLGLALAVLAWRWRVRRVNRANPQARYRNDIRALKHRPRMPATALRSDDIWSAGAASDSAHSKSKQTAAWVTLGAVGGWGGCGGCGGCGCGG